MISMSAVAEQARKKAWLVLTFTGTALSKPVVRVVQLKP